MLSRSIHSWLESFGDAYDRGAELTITADYQNDQLTVNEELSRDFGTRDSSLS